MVDVTVVYWRGIPAQVIGGRGRSASKVQLPERFEQAIDRAAMRAGLAGTDGYLAEWRKVAVATDETAEALARRLEAEYGPERLRALVEADGREA